MKYEPTQTIKTAGLSLDYSRGGLHYGQSGDFCADKSFLISDFDVSSLYPSLMIKYKLKPRHTPEEFLPLFERLVKDRLTAKAAGDKITANGLKLCINSLYGLTGNASADGNYTGPFYDPHCMLSVCLHGQMLMSKLLDEYLAEGYQVIAVNTDGIQIRYAADARERVLQINEEWQKATKLTLEETQIKRNFSRDVNNFIVVTTNGHVKAKGVFASGSGNRAAVIGTACQTHISREMPIEDVVRTAALSGDPRPFLMPITVRAPFEGMLRGKPVGNVLRCYHSTRGAQLYKRDEKRMLAVGGCDKVAICSVLEHVLPADLDIQAYITEAEELLGNKQQELNLF